MRIALLTLDFPPAFIGGISAWSVDMASALSSAGHDVEVFAKRTGDTHDFDGSLPFPVHRVFGRSWARWSGLWMRLAIHRHLDSFDWILCATWPLATSLGNTPRLAIAFHGSELTMLDDAPSTLKRVTKQARALLPVSRFLALELKRLDCADTPATVLPMPLKLETCTVIQQAQSLVCVARPSERKGIDRAIQIAQATGRNLDLIGPTHGPEGTTVHGQLTRDETMEIVSRSAAIVLTPRLTESGRGGEGLGLCLLEAAARGVPAIGCDTGGVSEAVGPGLVLSDPDHPDGDQINAWLSQADRGEQARAWVAAHHGPRRSIAVLEGALL